MKKILVLILTSAVLLTTPVAAWDSLWGKESSDSGKESLSASYTAEDYDPYIQKAIDALKVTWQEEAEHAPDLIPEPHADIKNTRIIQIAENPVLSDQDNEPVEMLADIDYIIEFILISNYYGDTYPCNVGVNDSVSVYKDGHVEAQKTKLLQLVRGRYYINDFSGIIDEIIDLDTAYNGDIFEK